jgi:prepilin-type N-terminal cleavage/methylation domain-containing protein
MNKGFTLLEIVIAITIFSISVILLLEIEARNIKYIDNSLKEIEALKFFQKHYLGIQSQDDRYSIKTEKKEIVPEIKEVKNKIIDRREKREILEIITYEK